MILHIPHSSTDTLGKEFLCDLDLELVRMTDMDTDKLFEHSKATKVIFPISRLVCDPERFDDDTLEEMAAKGMGVCYTQTAHGEPLRVLQEGEREELLKKYYRPHHQTLTDAVHNELDKHGQSLVIDCHSFPNDPLPCNINQDLDRPDICIGMDNFHTPMELATQAVEHFESCGYTVRTNDPFAGTLIPMEFYQKDKRVYGMMIEVNRDLYQDSFKEVQNNITTLLDKLDKDYL